MILKIPRIAITLFCCIFSVGISIWQRKFGLYGIPVLYLYFWIENVYLVLKSKKYEPIDGIVVRSGITKHPKIHVPYLHYTYVVGETIDFRKSVKTDTLIKCHGILKNSLRAYPKS